MIFHSFQPALRKGDIVPGAQVEFILPIGAAGIKWRIKRVRFCPQEALSAVYL